MPKIVKAKNLRVIQNITLPYWFRIEFKKIAKKRKTTMSVICEEAICEWAKKRDIKTLSNTE
jgi:hypothetical protein